MKKIYSKLANCHPALKEGLVKCDKCGKEKKVDSAKCFKDGWPKCCGYTMTLISKKQLNNND